NRVRLTPRIPDTDRYWLTMGVGIRPTSRIRIDLSYAHIFAPLAATRNPDPITHARLVGDFDASGDLFAFQLTYDIDWTFSDPLGRPPGSWPPASGPAPAIHEQLQPLLSLQRQLGECRCELCTPWSHRSATASRSRHPPADKTKLCPLQRV